MNIKPLHPNFKLPTRGTEHAAGYDIYMPEAGVILGDRTLCIPLGFATEIPQGYVALILPRSGVGARDGLALNNTCGVIDSDYRGEWLAVLKAHPNSSVKWEAGDRILQYVIVPVHTPVLNVVESLETSDRDAGGFGSTGQ